MVAGLSTVAPMSMVKAVSTINTTIRVGDDSVGILAGMLSHFPKGRRVHVALTEETGSETGSKPDLVDWLKSCPEKDWFTPSDTTGTTDDLDPLALE